MYKPSKSALREQAHFDSIIANAVYFTAFIQYAPLEKVRVECQTIDEAKQAAQHLNSKSEHGRRAIIYAVDNIGRDAVVTY